MSTSSRHIDTETLDPARRALFNTFVGLTSERHFTSLWQTDVDFNKRVLAPQAELGLLNEHDALMIAQTLSATTRASYTNLPNSILSGLLAHLSCNMLSKWTPVSPLSRSLVVSLSTVSSYWVQETVFPALLRKNLVLRVENPEGVNQALHNIRYGEDIYASSSFVTFPARQSAASSTDLPPPKSTNQNHWEEIRKTNSNKTSPSTWDQLRQRYESPDTEPDSNAPVQKDDSRARAQAEFDAEIDRERNMK
ncbi:hypothetical protein E1B28_001158 [Marasmius oreades]|uniref:Uncharacterized protein n=1 Tax=Marasmius oreades TaxID=181124 RepID=A0A9P8AFD1_9AGAR|nr:uncharacterized protein E1B28_001158 [Marasmius oreades]KAG7099300.1 hypothetical protein E1B28_001158 [Marasmius oreades]